MSDLERRLRAFPGEFPRPGDDATRRTRERLIVPPRRRSRPTSTTALLAASLAIGVFAGAASSASGVDRFAAAPGDPTIAARLYRIGQVDRLDLSGRIPVDRAGEPVQVLERACGYEHFRIATDVQTVAGGFWAKQEVPFYDTVTYVARWNGRLSDELTIRSPLYILPFPLKNRRWRVEVNTRLQSMAGKRIVLQRKTSDDRWVRVRDAKLGHGARFGSYQAVFRIPTRGLLLRVLVPQASARPCHDGQVSPTWPS